jgi:tetratricopeptide (TPR) repeat protein
MVATDAEYREISDTYSELREELMDLFKVGTNKAAVNDLLRQATHDLERGDYDRARLNLAKARSVARTSTANFLGRMIEEVGRVLVSIRGIGADVGKARPMLVAAKKALNQGEHRLAASLILGSVHAIRGLAEAYLECIIDVVRADYNLTLVESFGLDAGHARDVLERAMEDLKARNFQKARDHAEQVREEVRSINRDWTKTSRLLTDAKLAIDEARHKGADVSSAQSSLGEAMERMEKNAFSAARQKLRDAIEGAEAATPEPAGEEGEDMDSVVRKMRRTAKEAIDRTRGMGADVADAEMNYAVGWKRQQDGDMDGALRFYSRAIDEAISAGKAMAWKG